MEFPTTVSVEDTIKEIDFSVVKQYFLLNNDENNRIVVNSNVINYPSLKKRCKVVGNIVFIKLDTDNLNVLCDIANLCSGVSTLNRIGSTLSFLSQDS